MINFNNKQIEITEIQDFYIGGYVNNIWCQCGYNHTTTMGQICKQLIAEYKIKSRKCEGCEWIQSFSCRQCNDGSMYATAEVDTWTPADDERLISRGY